MKVECGQRRKQLRREVLVLMGQMIFRALGARKETANASQGTEPTSQKSDHL
jgi:hypothetical protein